MQQPCLEFIVHHASCAPTCTTLHNLTAFFRSHTTPSFPTHVAQVAHIELKKSKAPQPGFSHAAAVRCAAYNDRFAHLVTGGDDGLVRMWHAESGAIVFEFRGWHRGNKSAVRAITVSEGGSQLVTAMESGEINLWHYSTGQHVCRFVEASSTPFVSKVITVGWGNAHNVVTVGWSRRVSVFECTPREAHVEVLRPVNLWRAHESHSDDVTCLTAFGRNMVVTATYVPPRLPCRPLDLVGVLNTRSVP